MSWTVCGNVKNGQLERTSSTNVLTAEDEEQLDAAESAVADIVSSGAVGDRHGKYAYTLVGHSNHEHGAPEGLSTKEFVTVQVAQLGELGL